MIGKLKWRLTLSLLNLAAALAQSALGLHESRLIRHHDVVFFPPAQLISNGINAPAFLFTNIIGSASLRILRDDSWLGPYLFHQMNVGFYVALFFLWWWIGWRVDVRLKPSEYTRLTFFGNSLGTILSLALV